MELEIINYISNMGYSTIEEIKNYFGPDADGTLRQGITTEVLYVINGSKTFVDAIYNVINDPRIKIIQDAELCESIDGFRYCDYYIKNTQQNKSTTSGIKYMPLILSIK
jgi:hypothetical protein